MNPLTRSTGMWFRILHAFDGDPRRVEPAASLLMRLAAGSLCGLIGATWPLWSPGGEFPRVPLVGWFAGVPAWLEWTALAGCALAVVAIVIGGTRLRAGRWSAAISVLAFGLLVLVDQHRLQPWVYQLVVLAIIMAALPGAEAISLARILVASIYFFSALSKLDRSFFDSGGGQIVEGLVRCFGLTGQVSADNRAVLAGLVAMGELLVAAGLSWRGSRRYAWPASIAMHVLLLVALGPWGSQSKSGVLLWNVYFIVQNVVLFGLAGERRIIPSAGARPATSRSQRLPVDPQPKARQIGLAGRLRWLVRGVAAFVIVFPLTEPFGICDVWSAWAVYATGPERLRVFIEAADRDRLPAPLRDYVQPPRFEDGLCLIRIDRWSLDACRAPIYPQNRFRLGVALAIADRGALGDSILVELDSAANRFTGERTSRQLKGRAAIVSELNRYWLNGFPRKNGN
jgi:hypothetical protein